MMTMMGLRQHGLVHKRLFLTLRRQPRPISIPQNRQISLFRRHLGQDCHFLTQAIGGTSRTSTRFFSSTSTDTLLATAASSHVPIEPMSWYNPAQYLMDIAHLVHDSTGWPYAACIVFITAIGRMALFPLMVSSQRVRVKREDIQNALVRFSKTKPSKQAVQAKQKALRKQYGYHPSQLFTLPLANVALTMYMWFGMRWMGYYYPKEMSTGGVLWFTDLASSDPLMLLPILSGTCSILLFEVGTEIREMSKKQRLLGRVVAVSFVPILFYAPASVHLFWTSNWMMSAIQDVVLSQPAVREKLGLVRPSERIKDDTIVFIKDVEKEESKSDKEEGEVVETVVIKPKSKKGQKKNRRPTRR